ncbi:helix-turn-helix transcriptional regulator [Actinokineospora pegani]|uniref:helix-turn-helix transcriptional regulator n=1 Tax=Actinokineospora pegani TaxID=2654637 RepID=UPI001F3571E6|nr:helix-turn-helix transcriptional regulator [Actinokineospora pegani]
MVHKKIEYRTVLGLHLRQRRLTVEDFVKRVEQYARENKEEGTLSVRHAQRLVAGMRTAEQLRPATARLIEGYRGRSIEELLAPLNDLGPRPTGSGADTQLKPESPLKIARRRAGHTQESFAEAVGVEFSTVGRWERGQHRPQVWVRPKIARALNMTTEALVEMIEPSTSSSEDADKSGSAVSIYWSNTIYADSGVTEVRGDPDMPVNRRSFLSLASVAAVNMNVAEEFTASIAGGDADPLTHVQTTYEMDMAVASVVDKGTKNTLVRWTETQGNPVARVNAAGILAKMPDQGESAHVAAVLGNDGEVRRLYLTAVTMRVCSIDWGEAARFVEAPTAFPLASIAVERFMREVINPADIGARWCSAKMLQELSPVIGR